MNTNRQKRPVEMQPEQPAPDARGATRLRQLFGRTVRGLCSRRFVVVCLAACLLAELGTLGYGLAQRSNRGVSTEQYQQLLESNRLLEQARRKAEQRAAELDSALVQALDLAGSGYSGSAGIGGAAAPVSTASSVQSPATMDHDAPPPLRAADVDMLVFEETGVVIDRAPETDPTAQTSDSLPPEQQQLRTEDAQDADRLIRQGIAALVQGDMRRCILSFEEASLLAPNHPAMLYYYGMAYDKLLNPTKAREYYTRVFNMRSEAGAYFERASRRLKHGFDQPSDLRGKISFGPYTHSHTTDPESGERVSMRLPILVAPDCEISPQDIFIHIQFFVLVNDRTIRYSPTDPTVMWENETQDWSDNEENILISYNLPPLTREEKDAYGDMVYYGFTAKFFYKGEPIDCISSPSALILHEQLINARQSRVRQSAPASLLPDDGLVPSAEYETTSTVPPSEPAASSADETATPFSKFIEEIDPSTPETEQ